LTRLFFDTSALLKNYLVEDGTAEVQKILLGSAGLIISAVTLPEFCSATRRLAAQGLVTQAHTSSVESEFWQDAAEMEVIQVDQALLLRSVALIRVHSLKTLDAIQVASALQSGCDGFVTADQRQASAARKAGLKVLEV
jgi:predicted nucleic acid-binding protein